MSTAISNAKKCFAALVQLYPDQRKDPEKYYLYYGLFNLAKALEEIEKDIDSTDSKVQQLLRR